jgi:signal transduction histidine kinase
LSDFLTNEKNNPSVEPEKFRTTLLKKEKQLEQIVDEVSLNLSGRSLKEFVISNSQNLIEDLIEDNCAILIFRTDSLVFWSDNSIPIDENIQKLLNASQVLFLSNAWYYSLSEQFDDYTIVGLILLKHKYSYENKFLENKFQNDFELSSAYDISLSESGNNINIYDESGKYLLSLYRSRNFSNENSLNLTSIIFFFLAIIFFLLFVKEMVFRNCKSQILCFASIIVFLLFLRFLMIKYCFPAICYSHQLFDPQLFGKSFWFKSLGDFFINSIFLLYGVFLLFNFKNKLEIQNSDNRKSVIIIFVLLVFIELVFLSINYLMESIILNSTVNLYVFQIFEINVFTFFAYLIFASLILTLFLVVDFALKIISNLSKYSGFLIIFVATSIPVFVISFFAGYEIRHFSILFFYVFVVTISVFHYKKVQFQYSTIVLILLIVSSFTVLLIINTSSEKEKEIQKVLAVNISNQHDVVAELLLVDFEGKIKSDTQMTKFLESPYELEEEIYNHLKRNYFHGFWGKYNFQIYLCGETDSLIVEPENENRHCINFFSELIDNHGIIVENTNFYYLNNVSERISYLGYSKFPNLSDSAYFTVYFELNSKLVSQELGYPELLLNEKLSKLSSIDEYSYAKYKNNELVTQAGNFPYSLNSETYVLPDEEYFFTKFDDFDHLVYKIDNENTIILSKPAFKILDILISLSYIFVFYHLLVTLLSFIKVSSNRFSKVGISSYSFDLKNKIKLTMISILIFSLLLIGGGTIYYNIKQFEEKHHEIISEKIQSVLIEVEHKLANETEFSDEIYEYLTYYLIKFSNVFYSDINVYDLEGNLFSSSRSEIFNKFLVGRKTNPDAYRELIINKKAKFIHSENIGKLNFLSAYVPFRNNNNKIIAYLNLPYFTKQSVLKKEISVLVVAVVNMYVILILLTIAITVFVSNKLTKPLQLIQDKIRNTSLDKPNEPIDYESNDEIGNLIKDYNRMVEELAKSASLLAKSERETAWREMAKQIAHEIKNPLTPMKLNVQFLQKAWIDKVPNFDERLNKICNTIIEQIENLSSIATSFSNFAKMPKAKNAELNIIENLEKVIQLYKNLENISIKTSFPENSDLQVFADPEQLSRVFINIIQNAVQSIPEGRTGFISVGVYVETNKVVVKIADNGEGIESHLIDKLFVPNFTTKTSGMGLGLAIANKIVENANGEIRFETVENMGSSFYVELPLLNYEF